MHQTKMLESGAHQDEELYKAYEDSFNRYNELYQGIINALDVAESLKLRTIELERKEQKRRNIDRAIALIGVLVGVAGIVIGFLIR